MTLQDDVTVIIDLYNAGRLTYNQALEALIDLLRDASPNLTADQVRQSAVAIMSHRGKR